jgi:hypothetical protein
MKKKLPYYIADTGHFGIKIKVCFDDTSFQQAVRDSKITTRHQSLDVGLAESHYIQQEGTTAAMLAIVFNFDEMAKESALERMGVIYHEVSHTVTHVFEYIGEDDAKIGDESRSYLGEHIFKQVFSIYATEEDKRERTRERNRTTSNKTSEEVLRALVQMGGERDRGAGSDSISKSEGLSSRVKDSNRGPKSKASSRVRRLG